jgi:hypothetical protein
MPGDAEPGLGPELHLEYRRGRALAVSLRLRPQRLPGPQREPQLGHGPGRWLGPGLLSREAGAAAAAPVVPLGCWITQP